MPENELIAEFHRHRAELARQCDFDIRKLMAFYRMREAASEAAGRRLVSPLLLGSDGSRVREDSSEG